MIMNKLKIIVRSMIVNPTNNVTMLPTLLKMTCSLSYVFLLLLLLLYVEFNVEFISFSKVFMKIKFKKDFPYFEKCVTEEFSMIL